MTQRLDRIDLLRAAAMLWMTAYHFCFDLNFFRLIREDFYRDPFWTWQRTAIVSLFLFTAGLSQAVAVHQGQTWARFWRRWAQVLGCAVLVSIGSAWMFPRSWISFGVLHGIVVMLVLVRLAAPLRGWLWPLGALALLLPHVVQHAAFDSRWTNWVGLVTRKPVTEDYVPLLPWLGVMWWGVAVGRWASRERPQWLGNGVPARGGRKALVWLGRWSLSYYLLHQPVLMALIWLAMRLS